MMRKRRNSFASYAFNLLMLGVESQQVMALRLAHLAKGGKRAQRESALMLTEKITAGMRAGVDIFQGKPPARVLKGYRSKVRANRRRLSK